VLRATETAQAVAGALRLDRNLEYLYLQMEDGFIDEEGVAWAEALTINKALRVLQLDNFTLGQNQNTLGVQAYVVFATMLCVNTSLRLIVPPFETSADERLMNHYNEMVIELRLNEVSRGKLLLSSQFYSLFRLPRKQYYGSSSFACASSMSRTVAHPGVMWRIVPGNTPKFIKLILLSWNGCP
jgi:hypothetical protein